MASDDGGTATNHELNVKAAELVRRVWCGAILHIQDDRVYYIVQRTGRDDLDDPIYAEVLFSPTTSIEDAMGLLKTMPSMDEWRAVFNSVLVVDADIDTFARAITEAFIAAKKAATEASDGSA